MKKAIKIIAITLGVIILLVAVSGFILNSKGIPTYVVNAPDLKIEYDSARVANGERLVNMVCGSCHRDNDSRKLTGKKLIDIPEFFGEVYSANITNHPAEGIGRYSDGELAYTLRTGIRKDGRYMPPYMPKFPHMSNEDLYSIIAYLRSDSETTRADAKPTVPCRPSFMTKMLCNVAFKPLPFPKKEIKAPPIEDEVAHGKYILQGMTECYSCHSADFKTVNTMEPEKSEGYLGGGNKLLDMEGNIVVTPNITMDEESGIGKWTKEEFIKAVRFGQRPDGMAINMAMPKMTQLTDQEVGTIWEYLKTVPEIKN